MDVTPREVNEKQFRDAWRGYNQEEVDDFLDRVAETLEKIGREHESLRARNVELEHALATTREAEEMLKKTLVTAQRAAEEAIAKAKTKADQLVAEAERRARGANEEARKIFDEAESAAHKRTLEIEREAKEKRKDLDAEIARLSAYQADLSRRLRTFLQDQKSALDELVSGEPPAAGEGSGTAPRGGKSFAHEGSTPGPALVEETDPAESVVHVDINREAEALAENGEPATHRRGVRGLFFREEG